MALYMVGFISYGATLVFYAAAFPRLARNTPRARALLVKYEAGDVSREEYEKEESLEKNRISNISTVRRFCQALALLSQLTVMFYRLTVTSDTLSLFYSTYPFFYLWRITPWLTTTSWCL